MPASDNQQQTKLRDLYRYVGDDTLTQLPSLKTGARAWVEKLKKYPTLQTVRTQKDLATWISKNKNTGVHLDDFTNYEKLLRYQNAFPNGLPSEELQRRLQTEIRNEQADAQGQTNGPHAPGGHRTLDQFTKIIEPKGLDQDPNFKRILNNVVEEHNLINPNNPFTEKLIVKHGGERILNPNLPPELLQQARTVYGAALGEEKLVAMDQKEVSRIYKRQANDPAVRKMEHVIQQEVNAKELQLQASHGSTIKVPEQARQRVEQQIREKHVAQFVKDYPEKAAVYARHNPTIKEALKKEKQLQKRQSVLQKENNKVYRLNPSRDPAVKNLKAGTITPEEFVKKYPKKAKAYRRRIAEVGVARSAMVNQQKLEEKNLTQQQKQAKRLWKHKDPQTDTELQALKNRYPNRETDQAQKTAFEKDMNEFVRNKKRANSTEYQQDTDIKAAKARVTNAQQYLKRKGFFSRLFRKAPVIPTPQPGPSQEGQPQPEIQNQGQQKSNNRLKRVKAWFKNQREKRKKQIQHAARPYFSKQIRHQALNSLKQAAHLSRSGARYALGPGVRGASRAVPRMGSFVRSGMGGGGVPRVPSIPFRPPVPPAAAGLFSNPVFWIILAILLLLLIIIILFLGNEEDDGTVSVTVLKTGDEVVPNPPDPESNIDYQIQVTWSGGPNSITVTDYLPENTEFVSASGNYTLNDTARTVVWTLPSTGNASPSAETTDDPVTDPLDPRTQSRIFNQYLVPGLSSLMQNTKSVIVQKAHAQTSDFTYNHDIFAAEGYPQPSSDLPTLNPEGLQNWQAHVMPHVVKAANEVSIDAGFLGSWSFMEGINYDLTFNSCQEAIPLNQRCGHSNWQVGHGIRPMENLNSLREAFDVMYGSHDPDTIQSVGQSVLDAIQERHGETVTNPGSTFPRLTIEQLENVTNSSADSATKMWVGHLMRDDALYAYLQAVTMKWHWDRPEPLATIMERDWGSPSHYDRQRVINYVKATYDAGISGSGVGGGLGSGSEDLTLTLRPTENDSWVINRVTARAIGGGSGSAGGAGAPPGSVDGHCTPTGEYPSDLAGELRSKYNIILNGHSAEGAKMIYEVATCLSNSKFPTLLEGVTTTIHNSGSPRMSCNGDNCEIWMPESINAFKFILTHEFGHILYYTNPRETMRISDFENAWAQEGGLSPYSRRNDGCEALGSPSMAEDYAENVAYYYNPQGGKTGACDSRQDPPNPLYETSNYPLHLEVAKAVL